MTGNLDLWQSVEKTPTTQTKAITGKPYKGTSPKPYYIVQKATETFGPCGIGWGYSIHERVEEGAPGEKLHIAHIKLWYVWDGMRGEVEHVGQTMFSGKRKDGGSYTDEDAPKKSVTDALVKALSMLGFAGDIFIGRYDDSKYVNELREEERPEPRQSAPAQPPHSPALATMTAVLKECATVAAVNEWVDANGEAFNKLTDADWSILEDRITKWRAHVSKRAAA